MMLPKHMILYFFSCSTSIATYLAGYSTVVCDWNADGIMDIISGGPRANRYRGQVQLYYVIQNIRFQFSIHLVLNSNPLTNRIKSYQVFVYQPSHDGQGLPLVVDLPVDLMGEQMGSYYGSTLACSDVTGDGVADLIVGQSLSKIKSVDLLSGCDYSVSIPLNTYFQIANSTLLLFLRCTSVRYER